MNIRPLYIRSVLTMLVFAMLVASCNNKNSNKRFELLSSEETGVHFRNILKESPQINIFNYLYFYDGGGVAAGDLNRDGLPDLYFTSNLDSNRLYINQGDFKFVDITKSANVAGQKGWTTGVTMADVNGDGRLDIYVSQLGDFKNIRGRNQLYINLGNDENGFPLFEDQAKEWNLDLIGFSTQAAFFDYDLDGDLDMYMLNHSVHSFGTFARAEIRNENHPLAGDKLLRNDGDVFVDVTEEVGIYSSVLGYGLGISISDINWDGYPDIYVGNDFHEDDYLYINNGDGTFTDRLSEYIEHTSKSSMGNDVADFNNDGYIDIVSLDMLPDDPTLLKTAEGEDPFDIYFHKMNYGYKHQLARNTLQLNLGNGKFGEIALMSGIHATDWSWASLFADFDLDGYRDLFIANGIKRRSNDMDYISFISTDAIQHRLEGDLTEDELALANKMPVVKVPNFIYRNNQDLTFTNVAQEWGMNQNSFSNGSVYVDLDDDGDLDLVTNNVEDEAFIYRNNTISETTKENNFLKLHIRGKGANSYGIGTKVIIPNSENGTIVNELFTTRGFQSSVSPEIIVGLGEISEVDSLIVIWPDRTYRVLTDISANQKITIQQGNNDKVYAFNHSVSKLYEEFHNLHGISYKHRENRFIEFNREALIPHMTSTEGPALAVADVNGDGLDDFFVGGAKWQPGELYLQTGDGFMLLKQQDIENDSLCEDTGAIFLDIDQDRDMDLIVLSGGNEFRLNDEPSLVRLYVNDGNGNLTRSRQNIQDIHVMGSCVAVTDFNKDGYPDLFIGGRTVPRNYGKIPNSYFLLNDGEGKLYDRTAEIGGEDLSSLGMVKDATWKDLDGDGDEDLIVVGEWMPLTILINKSNKLVKHVDHNNSLKFSRGWWNSVLVEDVDSDGDQDIIAGNLGLNSKLKASKEEPLEMYVKDFDKDGSIDQLIFYEEDGKRYSFATKDELVTQIASIRNKFANYWEYAQADIYDIFPKKELEDAIHHMVYEFCSGVFINDGEMNFTFQPFPALAQVSPVNSILLVDPNHDGKNDLLLCGNFYEVNIQRGRYDASKGILLQNPGDGEFHVVFNDRSGLKVDGQVRDMAKINHKGKELILIARNNDTLQIIAETEK